MSDERVEELLAVRRDLNDLEVVVDATARILETRLERIEERAERIEQLLIDAVQKVA